MTLFKIVALNMEADSVRAPHSEEPTPTSIFDAARRGMTDAVRAFLDADPSNLSARDTNGNTSLHLAAFNGHGPIVATLLKEYSDDTQRLAALSARDNEDCTPLHLAALAGHTSILTTLILSGGDITQKIPSIGQTAIDILKDKLSEQAYDQFIHAIFETIITQMEMPRARRMLHFMLLCNEPGDYSPYKVLAVTHNRPELFIELVLMENCPDDFRCSITRQVIQDPAVAADGFTYERAAIDKWINKENPRHLSPKTGAALAHDHLSPSHAHMRQVANYFAGEDSYSEGDTSKAYDRALALFESERSKHEAKGRPMPDSGAGAGAAAELTSISGGA